MQEAYAQSSKAISTFESTERRIVFLTVIPSPYQRQLFSALHSDGRVKVRVLYCAASMSDRRWVIPTNLAPYERVLPGLTIQWLDEFAHFNPTIIRELRSEPNSLYVLGNYAAPTTQIAMRYLSWRGLPWVFWGELPGFKRRGPLGGLLRHQLQRPIGKGASAIAAIGSEAARAYKTLFPSVYVSNIPYFCDMADFRSAAKSKVPHEKKEIKALFSGELTERKGIDVLVKAFLKISDRVPRLTLELLGDGSACDRMMALIPKHLQDRVKFLGFQQPSRLPEIFASADIFVLPSRHDGWGVVVNEALGAGLPIIVTDCVGARDLVQDGYNGFVIRAGLVDDLAASLRKLSESNDLRRSFGRASAEASINWDVDEGVKRWVHLFEQIAAHKNS